jgi:hypothetical protein
VYFGTAVGKPILGAQIMIPVTSPLYFKYIKFSDIQKLFCKLSAYFMFSDVFLMPRYLVVISRWAAKIVARKPSFMPVACSY